MCADSPADELRDTLLGKLQAGDVVEGDRVARIDNVGDYLVHQVSVVLLQLRRQRGLVGGVRGGVRGGVVGVGGGEGALEGGLHERVLFQLPALRGKIL